MIGDRARRDVARRAQPRALHQLELQRHVDRAFDRRAADLAVALRRMRVADREQRALDLDRQVELDAFGDVARVHVAADVARRNDAVQARLGRRDADGSGEGPQRHAPARPVHRRREAGVVVPVMQPRVGELVGEQAEARDVAGPAPARRAQRQHRDLERVARLRAVDLDRAGDRVDAAEVELRRDRRRSRCARAGPTTHRRSRTARSRPARCVRQGAKALFQPWWMWSLWIVWPAQLAHAHCS